MDYLKTVNDPDINSVLDRADAIAEGLNRIEKDGIVQKADVFDAIAQTCRAFLQKRVYTHSFEGEAAELMSALQDMLIDNLENSANSIVLIPMMLEVMQVNNDNYKALTDFLAEGIAVEIAARKGIELEDEDATDYDGPGVEEINEQLHLSEMYSERGDYENAVSCLNRLIDMVNEFRENESSLLLMDLAGVYNNKAYYLFRLNRFQEALEAVDLGIGERKSMAILHYTKAEILDALGQFSEAVSCMDEAIRLEDSPDKHAFRKSVLSKIGH